MTRILTRWALPLCALATSTFAEAHPGELPAAPTTARATTARAAPAPLSRVDAAWIGRRIWINECAGRVDGLTYWSRNEPFPSLGIGHFLWYPAGREAPYQESFPGLLRHLVSEGVALPPWLTPGTPCPWPDRAAFQADLEGPRLRALRDLLARTVPQQTQYILARQRAALPQLLAALDTPPARQRIARLFEAMTRSPEGVFALADYTNFKGEGVALRERHAGQGWGLLQVLVELASAPPEGSACLAHGFARAAGVVLKRRVANDPTGKEVRWLKGWLKRVDGYRRPRRAEPATAPRCIRPLTWR